MLTSLFGALLLLSSNAAAQVNPTAAFTGQHQENFEGSMTIAPGYVPNPVLQGQANYYTNAAIQSASWSFGCTINPHGGTRFIGDLGGGLMWLEFNTAASKFGGYFGSNQPGIALTVNVLFFSYNDPGLDVMSTFALQGQINQYISANLTSTIIYNENTDTDFSQSGTQLGLQSMGNLGIGLTLKF
jgi:hypothetical protein